MLNMKAQEHACFHINFPFSAYFYPHCIIMVKGLLGAECDGPSCAQIKGEVYARLKSNNACSCPLLDAIYNRTSGFSSYIQFAYCSSAQ